MIDDDDLSFPDLYGHRLDEYGRSVLDAKNEVGDDD